MFGAVASRRRSTEIFIVGCGYFELNHSKLDQFEYGRICRTWPSGGIAKNKIKAHSPNVLDYPSNMSSWDRESLAAEAKLATERKSKKKLSTKNLISKLIRK
ncbi:MAG TPA: hypothetical protein VN902_03850 [Candidatus Acidoferrales bacterium]|nr:hypothetical protein [Candidatus Acidoferrales bacterium]